MSKVVPLEGFGGGGSSPLNFKIVAYATEEELAAAQPKENTIGVITTAEITSWIFSAEEPSPAETGMIWITVGTESSIKFNVLKKNGIQVYPISAKQYVGGAWVDVTAKSYQGGEWVEWTIYLYNAGNEYTGLTGGWTSISKRASFSNTSQSNAPALGKGSNTLTMTGVTNSGGIIYTKNKITITGKQKLVLDANVITSTTDAGQMVLRIWSELGTYHDDNTVASMAFTGNNAKDGLYYLDISSLDDGDYYIGFTFHGSVSKQIVMRSMALM